MRLRIQFLALAFILLATATTGCGGGASTESAEPARTAAPTTEPSEPAAPEPAAPPSQTTPPAAESTPDRTFTLGPDQTLLWESPDGQYAVVGTWDEAAVYDRPEVSLVTISTGEATLLPDPVLTEVYGLSPDGSRLAYSTPGAVNVYNLARGTRRVVLEAPCANYGPGWTVCGEIESGVWIDPQTLLVAHFAGSMPKELECEFGGLCEEPDADTYSIVDIRGHVVAQAPIPTDGPCSEWAGDLTDVRGSTVVLGDPPRCTFNLDDLSAGVVEPAPTTG